MNRLVLATFIALSPTFAFAYGAHGRPAMSWFGTQIVSSLIHAVIYGVVFKLFHSLGLVPTLALAAVLLFAAWRYSKQ